MFWLFSDTASQSYIKEYGYPYFFFDGDANDPDVQAVIKTNYISLLTSPLVPPFFCLPEEQCKADNVEAFAGSSGIAISAARFEHQLDGVRVMLVIGKYASFFARCCGAL